MRYLRQQKMLGKKEEKLHRLRVAVVGLGGIGGYAALFCAQLGVKRLVLIDRDRVRSTDLGRHALFAEKDVGEAKVAAAKERLHQVNPEVAVLIHDQQLDEKNASQLLGKADIVLDGTDNHQARAAVNSACMKLGKPWVFASALKGEGMVSFVGPRGKPCFACWAPEPRTEESCEQAGVLNITVSFAASLQVAQLADWACRRKAPLEGTLARFQLNPLRLESAKLSSDPHCRVCRGR